jgi:hypothetical protein
VGPAAIPIMLNKMANAYENTKTPRAFVNSAAGESERKGPVFGLRGTFRGAEIQLEKDSKLLNNIENN